MNELQTFWQPIWLSRELNDGFFVNFFLWERFKAEVEKVLVQKNSQNRCASCDSP